MKNGKITRPDRGIALVRQGLEHGGSLLLQLEEVALVSTHLTPHLRTERGEEKGVNEQICCSDDMKWLV